MFNDAHWQGGYGGNPTGKSGLEYPVEGIYSLKNPGPQNDMRLKPYFDEWSKRVEHVLPLFRQACKIITYVEKNDSLGSLVIGSPKPERNPKCGFAEHHDIKKP